MKLLSLIILTIGLQACVTYSFIDGSINAQTFSVSIFEEQAANAPAGYGGQFTEFLKDFMIGRTKLKLQNLDSDIQMSGKITSYNTSPIAIQSDNESAALNRLSITISVTCVNTLNDEESFEKSISQFSDYDASLDLGNVEAELLEDINNKLAQDIVTELTSNW
jgi:hypothetical protein